MRYIPKEVGRDLSYEEIFLPDKPAELQALKVAILRITYQRDHLCPTCGHQWTETQIMEKQQHVNPPHNLAG